MRVVDLCEMFWSYIMYRYSLNFKDVKKNLKTNSIYAWFILKNNSDEYNIGYYTDYHAALQAGDERFKEYVTDNLCKYSPGSFLWYNMKNIGKSLKDKPLVSTVSTDYLTEHSIKGKVSLCTHFCESYLMNFLKDDECYSVNDFNEEMHKMPGTLYTSIYPAKTIARECIKDFEKYLIENELI